MEFRAHSLLSLTLYTTAAVVSSHASQRGDMLWTLAYGLMTGIAGAHVYLVLRVLADLIYLTVHADNQFNSWWLLFVGLALGIFVAAQIYCLNRGLAVSEATVFLPVYQAMESLTIGVLSCLIFEEFSMRAWQWTLWVLGILSAAAGLLAVAHKSTVVQDPMFSVLEGQPEEKSLIGMVRIQDDNYDTQEEDDLDRYI